MLDAQPYEGDTGQPCEAVATVGALRLRGGPRRNRQHVAWGEGVVDNEGCEKKKSKGQSFDSTFLLKDG
jgi:protein phosphatase 1 regulatory subunit 11